MAVGCMRDHQRLHHQAVFLHQVRDAGIGVDDDFIGQAHLAAAITLLRAQEMLAERPVVIRHRHADRRIGVHHLLGGNDFQLVRIGVEAEVPGYAAHFVMRLLDQFNGPFRLLGQPAGVDGFVCDVAHVGCSHLGCFLNNSRNTG